MGVTATPNPQVSIIIKMLAPKRKPISRHVGVDQNNWLKQPVISALNIHMSFH
jgi:hypothetical protein